MISAFLNECLALAERGRGICAPNPAVGSVVVRDGLIVGRGWHRGPGLPHAEVEALKQVPIELSRGSTVYVTLEPCCHYGRTPPCTDLLIEREVAEVVFGYEDPNPIVKGKGRRALEAAGIRVRYERVSEIDAFYESYAYWTREKLPRVTAKLALSLDGKIAGKNGMPIQITGPALAERTHRYRRQHDAILTTARTVLRDNPRLNVRLAEEVLAKPLYVIDRRLEVPASARIFQHARSVTMFHSVESEAKKQVYIPSNAEGMEWDIILRTIGKAGIHDLWVEAGGACFSALIRKKKLHRALLYIGGRVLGEDAYPAFRGADITILDQALTGAKSVVWTGVGKDALGEVRF